MLTSLDVCLFSRAKDYSPFSVPWTPWGVVTGISRSEVLSQPPKQAATKQANSRPRPAMMHSFVLSICVEPALVHGWCVSPESLESSGLVPRTEVQGTPERGISRNSRQTGPRGENPGKRGPQALSLAQRCLPCPSRPKPPPRRMEPTVQEAAGSPSPCHQ